MKYSKAKHLFSGSKRTASPLTPALSPLRGEGEAAVGFTAPGLKAVASRLIKGVRAGLARLGLLELSFGFEPRSTSCESKTASISIFVQRIRAGVARADVNAGAGLDRIG